MKNKLKYYLFPGVCLALCLIPFAGMTVLRTDTTTENRRLAELPSLITEDGLNTGFLEDLGDYFSDHFALRSQLTAADNLMQGKVFRTSGTDTVIVGTDDWLYYTDSLEDYLGENTVSEREGYAIAHNLALVQERLADEGVTFLFTCAPNKNSLYGENMPYYDSLKAGTVRNIDRIAPQLETLGVSYTDMFGLFGGQSEVLYRKQDSHWNGKGALLAYNAVMDSLGREHEDYADAELSRTRTETGDLSTALYGIAAEPEWDYHVSYESNLTYLSDFTDWTDDTIRTESAGKSGSLLMFRDSFGNTLSPLIAEEYGEATFSKATVYLMDTYLEDSGADTVIVELVERNLRRLGDFSLSRQQSSGPPVMVGPQDTAELSSAAVQMDGSTTVTAANCTLQANYFLLTGTLDDSLVQENTNVTLEISDGTDTLAYKAYTVSADGNDSGFLLYLPKGYFFGSELTVRVYAETDGSYTLANESTVMIPE